MSKVGASIGVNIPLTENRYDRYTPVFIISDIDTEGDVDSQIVEALKVEEKVYNALSKFAEEKIKEEANKQHKLTEL